MSDVHAYRASDELAAALTARAHDVRAWSADVATWDAEHPDTRLLWKRGGLGGDRRLAGFTDEHPDRPAPDGLSRAQNRTELIPKRGRPGDEWREVMRRFDRYPSVDQVLRDHNVPTFVLRHDQGRSYFPGLLEDGATWWVTCTVQLFDGEHPHLTPAPLSAYYAAKEAAAARRDAEVTA